MDDGIELNFAATGGTLAPRKKQGGRWTDRLKANKLAKRRVEKPKAKPVAAAAAAAAAPAQRQPKQVPMFDLPDVAKRAPVQPDPRPAKRARTDTTATTAADDGFNNVDVSALVKSATTGHARPATQGSYSKPSHPASGAAQSAPNAQFISSLFSSNPTRPSAKTEIDLDATASDVRNASNAPLAAGTAGVRSGDSTTFQGLGLDPILIRHLSGKMSIERPTRIQRVALRGLLDPTPLTTHTPAGDFSLTPFLTSDPARQRDAFIQSQTGSGKTLSYLLPIIQTLLPLASRRDIGYIDRSIGTLAIILAPTRELARQIDDVVQRILNGLNLGITDAELEAIERGKPVVDETDDAPPKQVYGRYLVSAVLTGGATKNHEKTRLRRGCPILVCTPGRLLDHLQNTSSFKCDKLMWLVLDEADRLIEEGFGETLRGIMKALEGRRNIGYELDRTVGKSTLRAGAAAGKKKKKTAQAAKVVIPGFEDEDEDEDEDEAEDDEWDYETLGPKGAAAAAATATTEDINSANHTMWPYWDLGRRTILCSATVSGEVQKLAGVALKNPRMYRGTDVPEGENEDVPEPELKAIVSTLPAQQQATAAAESHKTGGERQEEKFTPPSQLDQRYMIVPLKLRLVTLVSLMRSLVAKANAAIKTGQATTGTKIIVFLSCTDSVDFHWQLLGGVQMGTVRNPPTKPDQVAHNCALLPSTSVMRLHGSLPVATRRASLQAFATPHTVTDGNQNAILLCTSVASRGLDLPLVKAVIQYDLPTEQGINEYVHRVGRTARVGRGGESWAFVEDHEQGWVDWVEAGMSHKGDQVQLRQVAVEDVLRRGFGGGSAKSHIEYEARATQVQLAFERWVLESDENAALARNAFSSYVRAYSTHPAEEKKYFHVKNLHLGHLAKSFALRETPGKIGAGKSAAKAKTSGAKNKNGKRAAVDSDDEFDVNTAKTKKKETDTERRMYEAVRKQGRAVRADGKLGELGNDAYQVYGGGGIELEKLVSGKKF
ncbi:hypothetical protein NliqN6_6194 [Naganishia liquefaciens]|uniref:ATP-dependent RNA helicase n=1 Tax=Naganishia liquefaciens TaxID=104408 RepID=A0A8H3TZ74_9TREE|nr:hypothetical protein NliqN6_6194 [Naganishia liquefaciens]